MFVVGGVAAVQRLVVGDPLGADHARIADVDHVGVGDVQRDAKAEQEHHAERKPGWRDQQAWRCRGFGPRLPAMPDPRQRQHAREQIDERRIDKRRGGIDVRVVEEGQRHREGQQHEQVEVQQTPGFAPVEERHEEQEAHRDPDVQRVHVPAKSARIAARHRPGDLKAGPLFEHVAGVVGDDHQADLLVLLGEVADLPAAGTLQIDVAEGAGIFGPHGAHLRQTVGDLQYPVGRAVASGRGRVRVGHGNRGFRFGAGRLVHAMGVVLDLAVAVSLRTMLAVASVSGEDFWACPLGGESRGPQS